MMMSHTLRRCCTPPPCWDVKSMSFPHSPRPLFGSAATKRRLSLLCKSLDRDASFEA